MRRDFERWPKYKELYIKAFERMIENHPGQIRIATGETAEGGVEMFRAWVEWCTFDGYNGTSDL